MLNRNVPKVLVRLISVCYNTQASIVRWGIAYLNPFYVTNGVRERGVLSPQLFNVYIDDLSISLIKLKVGCNLHGVSNNHLVFADDKILLATSPQALQN